MKAVHLSEEAGAGDDTSALEDLILAAVQDAQTRAEQVKRERLSDVTGGMDLPGLF